MKRKYVDTSVPKIRSLKSIRQRKGATLAINGGKKVVTKEIPFWPKVGDEEIEAVRDALYRSREDIRYLTSFVGGGPVEEFERAFSGYMQCKYALSTNSGTAALHIALMAAGVEVGDEVIVPAYTWGQSAGCILHQNAIPVFVDINPKTYTIDPTCIEAKINGKTKAIMVVHLYGHPADMDPILEISRRHNLKVIEDCAQAHGAKYKGRMVGSLGDIGCFSIGDGKNIIGGEGGILVTDYEELYEKAILMGMHPFRQSCELKNTELRIWIDSLGYTYRIHPLAAVLAKVQLKYLDKWNEKRRENARYLSQKLAEIPGIEPPFENPNCEHVFHRYAPNYVRDQLNGLPKKTYIDALNAEGVPIYSYIENPIYLRPSHQERQFFYGKHFPWSSRFARQGITYNAGDCPIAEKRCSEQELNITSYGWIDDERELLDQYVEAFHKVATHLEELNW